MVFLLFLDGVGIGAADRDRNPLFRAHLPTLSALLGNDLPHLRRRRVSSKRMECFGVDANLGMPGLPQSGTGQTSIFTGINAARVFGRHFGPFVPTALRPIVAETSLFSVVAKSGRKAILANAFPQRFFEYTESGTRRLSVTTFATLAAGLPLLTADDLGKNDAVSADFVRSRWKELGHPNVEPVTAFEAGQHCAEIVSRNDLTVFDYWLTDHAGHAQDMNRAVKAFELLDEFLRGSLAGLDLRRTSVVAISDHGNVEDLRVKTHTRNPALCFAMGKGRKRASERIRSLTDVAPFIRDCLNVSM